MSAEPSKFRLFVALPVPVEVKARLAAVQQEVRDLLSPGVASWIRPENTHLTLRFLGNVDVARIAALTASLSTSLKKHRQVHLVSEGLGCFPSLRHPRVLWAGVHDAADQLPGLQQRIVSATNAFTGEPAEERFVGHLTLARIKQIKRAQADTISSFVNASVHRGFGEWRADRVELMRSELSGGGCRYTCLAALPLLA
jgi:RNA 2',3'-cyclic 3'-phosphodiesterase